MGQVPTLQPFVSVAFFNFFVPLEKMSREMLESDFLRKGIMFVFLGEKKIQMPPRGDVRSEIFGG